MTADEHEPDEWSDPIALTLDGSIECGPVAYMRWRPSGKLDVA